MSQAKKISRGILTSFARMAPTNSPAYIYKYALSNPLLRNLTNQVLLSLVSDTITLPEGVLFLDPSDPVISGAVTLGVFEVYEIEIFRKFLKAGMTVIDIGANIGYYTLVAAKGVGQEGHVYAFEPEPISRGFLKKNMDTNDCGNVSIFENAISNKKDHAVLHISKENKGNHSIVDLPNRSREFTTSVEIATDTLDNIRASEKITNVDIIKIDVEGAEEFVLKGMPEILHLPELTIFIEFFPENLRQAGSDPLNVLTILTSHGFSLFNMNSQKRALEVVHDHSAFVSSFPKKSYTNLLCVKTAKS